MSAIGGKSSGSAPPEETKLVALSSMTGFGAASGTVDFGDGDSVQYAWELRSVNGRGLDIKLRLPSGAESIDPAIRERARAVLARGNIQASLNVTQSKMGSSVRVDDEALRTVIAAVERVQETTECRPPSADGLLGLKGVLMTEERATIDEARQATLNNAFVAGFEAALSALVEARAGEGARLLTAMTGLLDAIRADVDAAEEIAPTAQTHHMTTLRTQMQELLSGAADEDRLLEEAAALAVKSDIREEIDRLRSHLTEAEALFISDSAVGRKLDFLGQEFVREANTLTVKAPIIELKKIGLSLKTLVDQFKEQAANIE